MPTDNTPENKVDIVIYVNGTIKDDTPLGWLIHDLSCKDVSKMHYPALAKRARYLKETEKGMREMTGPLMKLIEEQKKIAAEAATKAAAESAKIAAEAAAESAAKAARESTIRAGAKNGLPADLLARITNLDISEVRAILEKAS